MINASLNSYRLDRFVGDTNADASARLPMNAAMNLLSRVDDAIASGSLGRQAEMLPPRDRSVRDRLAAMYRRGRRGLRQRVHAACRRDRDCGAGAAGGPAWRRFQNAPPITVRALALDDAIEVAGPVLKLIRRLDDPTLIEVASTKGPEHLLAISQRPTLSEAVTEVLVVRGDQMVVLSTAENRGAKFSETGYTTLVRRAEGDERLTLCVGSRPEIPLHHFLRLLDKASDTVRAKLEAVYPPGQAPGSRGRERGGRPHREATCSTRSATMRPRWRSPRRCTGWASSTTSGCEALRSRGATSNT